MERPGTWCAVMYVATTWSILRTCSDVSAAADPANDVHSPRKLSATRQPRFATIDMSKA
jgi:hypothetical protein